MEMLLTNATTNSTGDTQGGAALAMYPVKNIWCWGDFDGAGVTVEVSPDAEHWFDATDNNGDPLVFTSAGCRAIDARAAYFRATLADAGAETNLSCGVT